jgi:hypothetical protein
VKTRSTRRTEARIELLPAIVRKLPRDTTIARSIMTDPEETDHTDEYDNSHVMCFKLSTIVVSLVDDEGIRWGNISKLSKSTVPMLGVSSHTIQTCGMKYIGSCRKKSIW